MKHESVVLFSESFSTVSSENGEAAMADLYFYKDDQDILNLSSKYLARFNTDSRICTRRREPMHRETDLRRYGVFL